MSTAYISVELRRQVLSEADNICEYCLIHEDDTFFGCHVDHIISEKHGGLTNADNLAFACSVCNLRKGSDISFNGKMSEILSNFSAAKMRRMSPMLERDKAADIFNVGLFRAQAQMTQAANAPTHMVATARICYIVEESRVNKYE